MRVHIDKTRGDDQPGRIDFFAPAALDTADGGYAVAADGDIAAIRFAAAAIDDAAVANNQIEFGHGCLLSCRSAGFLCVQAIYGAWRVASSDHSPAWPPGDGVARSRNSFPIERTAFGSKRTAFGLNRTTSGQTRSTPSDSNRILALPVAFVGRLFFIGSP